MVAIRSFMDTDAKGQLGGIECSAQARKKMAAESGAYKCPVCAKSNADIIKEREEAAAVQEAKEGKKKEETVPEELRLAYRDELEKGESSRAEPEKEPKGKEKDQDPPTASSLAAATSSTPAAPAAQAGAPSSAIPSPTRTVHPPVQQVARTTESSLAWIDACIYGIVAALLFMVLRKMV
jgi:ubiquitin-conjugating enzyme E2 J1